MEKKDKIYFYPVQNNSDGSTTAIRLDKDGIHTGTITPMKDGKPVPPGHECIHYQPIDGQAPWAEGEVLYSNNVEGHGPAKVNSEAFKSGWDAIWGNKSKTPN